MYCLFTGKGMNEGTAGLIELVPRGRQIVGHNLRNEPNVYLSDSQVKTLGEDGTILCESSDLQVHWFGA